MLNKIESPTRRSGGTFYVEVLIALLFFMLCAAAMFGVVHRAQTLSLDSYVLTRASAAAQDLMERLIAQPSDITVYYDDNFAAADPSDYAYVARASAVADSGDVKNGADIADVTVYTLTVSVEDADGELIYSLSSAEVRENAA